MFVVVAGNIGAGKSTFCAALAEAMSLRLVEEPWRENPYLERAYADPAAWRALAAEWFLDAGIEQHRDLLARGGLHDRGAEEHYQVFGRHYRSEGLVDDATWERMTRAYAEYQSLSHPDALVYLRTTPDVLIERIRIRERNMESVIDGRLLSGLHRQLEAMVTKWDPQRLITVDPYPIECIDAVVQGTADRLLGQ